MLKLFIAYRKDSDVWRDRVKNALLDLAKLDDGNSYPVSVWSDDHLVAGDQWEAKIGVSIDACDVFLLIVTTDLNGGYALEVELKRAIHRAKNNERCRIVPIIVDNVVMFLGNAGLTEFAFHAVPAGGKGLSQKPFQGHVDRWIDALVVDLKTLITRELSGEQWNGLDAGKSAEEVRLKTEKVHSALSEDRPALSAWPKVQFALERTDDLLASGPDGVRDRLSAVKRHVGEARRDARAAKAQRTADALLELGASLDDLADATLLAGFQSYSDTQRVTEMPSGAPEARDQLARLTSQLTETGEGADALEIASMQLKKAQKDFLRGAAARIGAETRIAKAAASSDVVEPGLLVSTTEQLVETIEAVDVQATASGLSAKPKSIITHVAKSAQRAQSTAIGIAAGVESGAFQLSGRPADEFVQAALDDPNYKVFTRDFDEQVTAEALIEPDNLDRLFKFVTSPNLRGRTLLATVPRSLKEIIASRSMETAVSILIDNSGSMRGRQIAVTAAAVNQLGTLLARYDVPFEILGFTTGAWKGGRSKMRWIQNGKKPKHPGRLNDLRHIIYKDMKSDWSESARNLGLMAADGLLKENIDGEAVLWSIRRLLQIRRKRRTLLVLSDGAPVDDSTLSAMPGNYLERHLRFVVGKINELSDVQLLAIGINHDASDYYPGAFSTKISRGVAEDLYPSIIATMHRIFGE